MHRLEIEPDSLTKRQEIAAALEALDLGECPSCHVWKPLARFGTYAVKVADARRHVIVGPCFTCAELRR
ncbi:MAG: hypothetical protein JO290_11890 [Sphingomonadaceae bacterium]|nr:hypothetical protein [Sphingomonadaceae bacterium]